MKIREKRKPRRMEQLTNRNRLRDFSKEWSSDHVHEGYFAFITQKKN